MFGTETARNAPKKFIFTAATWVRGLIRPDPGQALIYSDYKSQELVVAAHLSGDENLKQAVAFGDAYVWFGKKVGLMPEDATDQTHPHLREKMKPILLGSNYGLTAHGARIQTGLSYAGAEQLLEHHRRLFPRHWAWAHDTIHGGGERLEIRSRWGWRVAVTNGSNPRSLQNHPVETTGAHILHFAVIGLEQAGVEVNATVHDAVLSSCRAADISRHCTTVEQQMVRAAEVALGSTIAVDHKVIVAPHRFDDRRGRSMFQRVIRLREGLGG